jgi:regulator of protease activity HflC (stomatin/prohibitin superfamily)
MDSHSHHLSASNFPPPSSEGGRFVTSLLFLLAMAGGMMAVIAFVFGTIVPVGSVGVRKIAFGPGQGLRDRSLSPGLQWAVPYYSTIYQVPQTLRILDFARPDEGQVPQFGSLDIPTVDGTTVDVDAAVLYRFYPTEGTTDGVEHGGPADLIQNVGATDAQWSKYLSQVAENELKRALSALSTVEFYEPGAREARVKVAEQMLRERLAPLGVDIQAVLLRRYRYREEIDQAIFKKNLQELESAYNKVAGEFAEAQRDVNQVESDGNVKIQSLEKRGIGDAEMIRSEGDLYRREKYAQGDLLIAEARAAVDRMRGEVLSKVGGEVYVALQLAQFLASLKGGVVTNLDPYDFDAWVKKLAGATPQRESTTEAK